MWLCISVAGFLVGITLYAMSKLHPYAANLSLINSNFSFTFHNSMWFTLASLMQQGCDTTPSTASGRIIGEASVFLLPHQKLLQLNFRNILVVFHADHNSHLYSQFSSIPDSDEDGISNREPVRPRQSSITELETMKERL